MKPAEMVVPLTGREPPQGWTRYWDTPYDGFWENHKRNLKVIASFMRYGDGRMWLHVSMSHPRRMPTYEELTYLKRHWFGDDRKCVMVLPPREEHVNIHPNCLHLYSCMDGDPLPDFTMGTGSI